MVDRRNWSDVVHDEYLRHVLDRRLRTHFSPSQEGELDHLTSDEIREANDAIRISLQKLIIEDDEEYFNN